ncbi:hypothetical protein B4U80_13868, partial [Leptotrombidium deliense]
MTIDRKEPTVDSRGTVESKSPVLQRGGKKTLLYRSYLGTIRDADSQYKNPTGEEAYFKQSMFIHYNSLQLIQINPPYEGQLLPLDSISLNAWTCNKSFVKANGVECLKYKSRKDDFCVKRLLLGKYPIDVDPSALLKHTEKFSVPQIFVHRLTNYTPFEYELQFFNQDRRGRKIMYKIVLPKTNYVCLPLDLLMYKIDADGLRVTKMIPLEVFHICAKTSNMPISKKCMSNFDLSVARDSIKLAGNSFWPCIVMFFKVFINTRFTKFCGYEGDTFDIHYMSYKYIYDGKPRQLQKTVQLAKKPVKSYSIVIHRHVNIQEGTTMALKCDYPKELKGGLFQNDVQAKTLYWIYSSEEQKKRVTLLEIIAAKGNNLLPKYDEDKEADESKEEYKYKDQKDFFILRNVKSDDAGTYTCLVRYSANWRQYVVHYRVYIIDSVLKLSGSEASNKVTQTLLLDAGETFVMPIDIKKYITQVDSKRELHAMSVEIRTHNEIMFSVHTTFRKKPAYDYTRRQSYEIKDIGNRLKNYIAYDGNIIPVYDYFPRSISSRWDLTPPAYPSYIIFDNQTIVNDELVQFWFRNYLFVVLSAIQYPGRYDPNAKPTRIVVAHFKLLVHDWEEQHYYTTYKNIYHIGFEIQDPAART